MKVCNKKPVSRDGLGFYLNSLGLLGEGVEVGVYQGYFSDKLLCSWKGNKLYMVDSWRHLDNYTDISNVSTEDHLLNKKKAESVASKYGNRAIIVNKLSVDAALDFCDLSLDFVYLDANHTFFSVLQDLNTWYRKVKVGGLMSGHDYLDGSLDAGEFGVKSAVNEFMHSIGVREVELTSDAPWLTWYFLKTKE
jgi:hypothetical protein